MRLMIVDDHTGVRQLIRQVATRAADVVCECATGDEAVERASEFLPEAVTMDLRMPGLCGFNAVREIRRRCPLACILILTSHDEPGFRELAQAVGADGFLAKDHLSELPRILAKARDRGSNIPEEKDPFSAADRAEDEDEGLSVKAGDPSHPSDSTSNDSNIPPGQGADWPELRVLLIEDDAWDFELIVHELMACGFQPVVTRVVTRSEMRHALQQQGWDIVLTDHRLTTFGGLEALKLLEAEQLAIPVLCVTGSNDPNVLKAMLAAGARECINKDNLRGLCAAVNRALGRDSL